MARLSERNRGPCKRVRGSTWCMGSVRLHTVFSSYVRGDLYLVGSLSLYNAVEDAAYLEYCIRRNKLYFQYVGANRVPHIEI